MVWQGQCPSHSCITTVYCSRKVFFLMRRSEIPHLQAYLEKRKTSRRKPPRDACRGKGEGTRGDYNLPQILIGASSSRRFGCARKMSLDARHSCRISASESCTCLPGLPLRTSRSLVMMSSSVVVSITKCIPFPFLLLLSLPVRRLPLP